MGTKKNNIIKNQTEKRIAIFSDKVGNYEKDPYFIKKKEAAKAFLKNAGLPASWVKK